MKKKQKLFNVLSLKNLKYVDLETIGDVIYTLNHISLYGSEYDGICDAIENENDICIYTWVLFSQWPKWSGSINFPVPDPDFSDINVFEGDEIFSRA